MRRCPLCKKKFETSPWDPFCSERCKLIDLGNWASGRYMVSRPIGPEDEEDLEEQRAGDER
jgi:hypothetical protein